MTNPHQDNQLGSLAILARRWVSGDKTTSRIYDGYGRVADPATEALWRGSSMFTILLLTLRTILLSIPAMVRRFSQYQCFSSPAGIDIQAFDLTSFAYVNAILRPRTLSGSKIVPWGSSEVAVA